MNIPAEASGLPPDDVVSTHENVINQEKTNIKEPVKPNREERTGVQNAQVIQLTRQQLYDEIWKISVAGVAKKYGVPYSALMKQIKEANIPVPPSGYWTKLSFGKPVKQEDLGEPHNGIVTISQSVNPTKRMKKDEKENPESSTHTVSTSANETVVHTVSPQQQSDAREKTCGNEKDSARSLSVEISQEPHLQDRAEPETLVEYGQTYNVYNRETLYREVWEEPVSTVAKRYKVSDVAIHKVCKSLGIPTPSLGYWAKLRAGKQVVKEPLPKGERPVQKVGVQTGVAEQQVTSKDTLAFLSEEDRSVIISVASQILLPDVNDRMHPKIVAHRRKIVEWKIKHSNKERAKWGQRNADPPPFLADGVSEDSIPRICRIVDALIKAIEPLGCALTDNLGFVVNADTVLLSVSEAQDKVDHVLTHDENLQLIRYEQERKRSAYASKPQIRKYDNQYNGRLTVTINGRKIFRDSKSTLVESRLGEMMIALFDAAQCIKEDRLAREEQERKRKEDERLREEQRTRYKKEAEKTIALCNLSEDYDMACKMRRLVMAVESSGPQSEETQSWIEWAKAKADWYDPVISKKDEILGKREHEKDADQKDLKPKNVWPFGWDHFR